MGSRRWGSRPGRPRLFSERAWRRQARRSKNPLLRKTSGLERAVALGGLLVLLLVAAAAVWLVLRVRDQGLAAERRDAAHRLRVTATVESAITVPVTGSAASDPVVASVSYRWRGSLRPALALVSRHVATGARVPIWVDTAGWPAADPHSATDTLTAEVITGTAGASVALGAAVAGVAGYRRWLLRRRWASWDAEWRQLDPYAAGPGR